MSRRRRVAPAAIAALALSLLACESAPLAPATESPDFALSAGAAAAAAKMQVPVFQEITDVNPCTGELVTITYTGTGDVRGGGDNLIVQSRGTVATSDGYTGTFDWTFVFVEERVTHFRFHDAEVSNETGQKVVFSVGLNHTTWKDGEAVVSFTHASGPRCVG